MIKGNEDLQKDVQNVIKWEPMLHAAEIGVTAIGGIITLSGTVDNYSKKQEAAFAAKSVKGVQAVVENIKIEFGGWHKKTDNELAIKAVAALKGNWKVPKEQIKIKAEDGWMTLTGDIHRNFEKITAGESIENLVGVKEVSNNVTINPATNDRSTYCCQ